MPGSGDQYQSWLYCVIGKKEDRVRCKVSSWFCFSPTFCHLEEANSMIVCRWVVTTLSHIVAPIFNGLAHAWNLWQATCKQLHWCRNLLGGTVEIKCHPHVGANWPSHFLQNVSIMKATSPANLKIKASAMSPSSKSYGNIASVYVSICAVSYAVVLTPQCFSIQASVH